MTRVIFQQQLESKMSTTVTFFCKSVVAPADASLLVKDDDFLSRHFRPATKHELDQFVRIVSGSSRRAVNV